LQLRGFVASPDGKQMVSTSLNGRPEDGEALGKSMAQHLIAQGADKILAEIIPANGW